MSVGRMFIEIAENATGEYVRLRWANGVLPMHADITGEMRLRMAQRLAHDMGAELHITDAAREALGVVKHSLTPDGEGRG